MQRILWEFSKQLKPFCEQAKVKLAATVEFAEVQLDSKIQPVAL